MKGWGETVVKSARVCRGHKIKSPLIIYQLKQLIFVTNSVKAIAENDMRCIVL